MINNAVLLSVVQKSDSVAHTLVSILFQNLFPFRLLHNIEQSSLCYTVRPCYLPSLNIAVSIPDSLTIPSAPYPSPLVTKRNH